MTINEVITIKYSNLLCFCSKNIIIRTEIKNGHIKDFEDIDILHTLIIRWLKKYKNINILDIDVLYHQLRKELIGELKYSKKYKSDSFQFTEITSYMNYNISEED
jgi:hypothetical protein